MPDKTFDAVIIGGGTKGLFLAMYLTKYANMSVGIFERRHEIGGGLATEEIAAPGFRGNTHASIQLPWYYLPLWRDFPEFWDYGAKIDQYLVSEGAVFRNNQTCLAIYSHKDDPTQERTAKEIARFSERDADRWVKLWDMFTSEELQHVQMDMLFHPAEERMDQEIMDRQVAAYPKIVESGFEPDSLVFAASHLRSAREYWESKELQYCAVRFALSGAFDVTHPGNGAQAFAMAATLPTISFARGGTHQVAHAAHQILVQNGCQFFTHSEVDKVIVENGTATGIRLNDGTEIGARKLVVSAGLNPWQVCFDLLGRDYFDYQAARRVELLEHTFGCLMWYTIALHESPKYEAAAFNPDINKAYWLGLSEDNDPQRIARECLWSQLGKFSPMEDFAPVVWCHSLFDSTYAPPGKHTASTEQLAPPASAYTVQEWLEIKKRYTEELLTFWQKFAPNMTDANIIGVDTNSPLDHCRLKNMAPNGNMSSIDHVPYQFAENRPTPELANHRLPVKNFYATGAAWHSGANSGSTEAYNCYRIISKDLDLPKPWEEPGKEEPYSLYEQWKTINQKIKDIPRKKDGE
jgi:phytoene dehydrogenase-like protein